ncbi:hypothetical protein [Singulisphaera sp. PoT]|uniref:hypothetical protein n=1 Tax=Singulisphaera sp. PoT TaxID=3411797 RepID=UPI003BF523CB
MARGLRFAMMFILIALPAAGAMSLARGQGGANPAGEAPPAPAPPQATAHDIANQPAPADVYAKIKAEYEDKESAMQDAMSKAVRQRERNQAYEKTAPDEAAFARRMIDLAESTPGSKAARDALLWVLNKPNLWDDGPYGDQFARASALLLRHYGDDPEAIRIGLQLDNIPSPHRDALLLGFLASAKGRESQGLARLGLAQYLDLKARLVRNDRLTTGRQKIILQGVIDDDGKAIDMPVEPSDERYAYTLQQRLYDPDAIAAESERLLREVIDKYADIPFVTVWQREIEAILQMPAPTWKNRPLSDELRKQFEKYLLPGKTLGQVAKARLDEIRNRPVGGERKSKRPPG